MEWAGHAEVLLRMNAEMKRSADVEARWQFLQRQDDSAGIKGGY